LSKAIPEKLRCQHSRCLSAFGRFPALSGSI